MIPRGAILKISQAEIQKRVDSYLKSGSGAAKVSHVKEEILQGRRKPASGKRVPKPERMASDLIKCIQAAIPEQIANAGTTLHVVSIKVTDDGYAIEISFDRDALHRESLEWVDADGSPTGMSSGGIQNIVALFNNGYGPISKSFYGAWNTHGGNIVKTMPERPALHFMQDAVRVFNLKYGGKYDVTVTLSDEYK